MSNMGTLPAGGWKRRPVGDTTQSKVGVASQAAEYVSNVVGRLDTCLEGRIPTINDTFNDFRASAE